MAFKFRSKSSLANNYPKQQQHANQNVSENIASSDVAPKLSNAQLNKLTKLFPAWLKDNSGLKQLPGVYQGVLGQVQLQPGLNIEGQLSNEHRLALISRPLQADYMNRFTDTERVHQLLSASQLSNDTLATIWAHVNKTFPGKLTNREVCLALALIAIFQRLEKEAPQACNNNQSQGRDPFSLVKNEKRPPVPILYPNHRNGSANNKNSRNLKLSKTQVVPSKSIPDELGSSSLLVDIRDETVATATSDEGINLAGSHPFLSSLMWSARSNDDSRLGGVKSKKAVQLGQQQRQLHHCGLKSIQKNSVNLIDMDEDRFEIEFSKLTQTWLRFLIAMRNTFKRSFDILNVENSRQSAIEALKSPNGKQFSKNLCLCYPLAHNIKFKIDELNNLLLISIACGNNEQICLFDNIYIVRIDDLMTSINEYWAVLINLFNESGQTGFIELIMDGLNYKQQTISSKTIEELAIELDSLGKSSVCCICHTKFYLANCDISSDVRSLSVEDAELLANDEPLISEDNQYYYHARCANFWLNQVDLSSCLPFCKQPELGILSPAAVARINKSSPDVIG